MKIDTWLEGALADAERRGLPALKPHLEALAQAIVTLRSADFNGRADGQDREDAPRDAHE
jgi:hypothetical protein